MVAQRADKRDKHGVAKRLSFSLSSLIKLANYIRMYYGQAPGKFWCKLDSGLVLIMDTSLCGYIGDFFGVVQWRGMGGVA